jgi:ABC-2 type transport system permease protein
MLLISKFRYGMQIPGNIAAVLFFIVLGVVAVRAIGLIIAAVVNSIQESTILVQITYMTMLFLSGASFPASMFPGWLLTITQFIPATYLVTGMQGILLRHESLAVNWQSVGALVLTAVIGLLLSVKFSRCFFLSSCWARGRRTRRTTSARRGFWSARWRVHAPC